MRGRRRGCTDLRVSTLRYPVLIPLDIIRIAQTQVLVRNALAARQHRVGKLLGLEMRITADVLEPFHGVPRSALDLQHFDGARVLVNGKHLVHALGAMNCATARELDGIFERELGAGADRIVRRMRRVAHQHDRHSFGADVDPMHPVAANDAREFDPDRRTAEVRCVGEQRIAGELSCEELFAERNPFLLAHPVEARLQPHYFGGFDDERRRVAVELIDVRLKPAVLGLGESERERGEASLGAEPDKTTKARVDIGQKHVRVAGADTAVATVAGNHEIGIIGIGHRGLVGDIGLEH